MRVKLSLAGTSRFAVEPDHSYFLTGVLYRILRNSGTDYHHFLHELGYSSRSNPDKLYKLYTFSALRGRSYMSNGRLLFEDNKCEWFISGVKPEFFENLLEGIKNRPEIIVDQECLDITAVSKIEDPPFFRNNNKFVCLSPVVMALDNSRGASSFALPDDPDYVGCITNNLAKKYEAAYGTSPTDQKLRLEFDPSYVARRKIVRSSFYRDQRNIGVFAPVNLSGSVELIKAAYELGMGNRNSIGYGMLGV